MFDVRSLLIFLVAQATFFGSIAQACPFCGAVGPTLSQQREAAAVAVLAEFDASQGKRQVYRVHQSLIGAEHLPNTDSLEIPALEAAEHAGLLLLLADGNAEDGLERLQWKSIPVNETSYAYIAQAPSLRTPAAERLRYFAKYLDHADPVIAEDAFREFGHAPYDAVAEVADLLPSEQFRAWLVDPNYPDSRKGFLGLALGLAKTESARNANAEFLRGQIIKPASDFRSGFDGILGGYLIAGGPAALDLIEQRFLMNPEAADGDVRHAMQALRFYHEYGRQIPPERLHEALSHLLARPEFAASAIVDLARWQAWKTLDKVAPLYSNPTYAQPAIHRAIVNYLKVCPEARAADQLAMLRRQDPQGVAAAERDPIFSGR
jgi:hypothetical protein